MNAGDVVLVPIPQSDGQVKNRPVVLLKAFPPYGDFLACGISSQLRQHVAGFDDLVSPGDEDFSSSGLTRESAIRLGFLSLVPTPLPLGAIGSISAERLRRLLGRLSDYLRP